MGARRTWMFVGMFALAVAICAAVLGQRAGSVSATGALQITAGGFHTCALMSNGGVECWGRNDSGQLGDGTTTSSATPVEVSGLSGGVAAVSAGGAHTCALTSAGGVVCWGRNDFGQLGNGTTTSSPTTTPVAVSGLGSGVAAISAGGFHTCAVTTAGTTKCWGRNASGQLGDGTAANRATPVDVLGFPNGAAAVSAGGSDGGGGHTCGVNASGGAECWGWNYFGQIGDGTTSGHVSPVPVSGLSGGVADVRGGRYHTCGLTSGGGVKCWGWDMGGQLGDGGSTTQTTPVDVVGLSDGVDALSVGGVHSCALTASGGVKCWGYNNTGQVGDGTSGNNRTAPVDVLEAAGGQPLTEVASVAAGGSITTGGHTCVLMDDGGVKCWGANGFGQLGDGTTTSRSIPVDVLGVAPDPTATATATVTSTATATDTPPPPATSTPMPTNTQVPAPTATPLPPTTEELFDALDEAVDNLDVRAGVRNSLDSKLDNALRQAQRGQECAAANSLNALINEIEALLRSGRISEAEASDLIAQIELVIERLTAEGDCRR